LRYQPHAIISTFKMATQTSNTLAPPAANITRNAIAFSTSATTTALPAGITVEQLRHFGEIDWDGEIWDESCFEGELNEEQEIVGEYCLIVQIHMNEIIKFDVVGRVIKYRHDVKSESTPRKCGERPIWRLQLYGRRIH